MLLKKKTVLYALCLSAALSGGTALTQYAQGRETMPCCAADTTSYVLRDCGGFVAVYDGTEAKKPTTVTDIEVPTLRGADRQLLKNGLVLDSREKLIMTLEDLGS